MGKAGKGRREMEKRKQKRREERIPSATKF